MTCRILIKYYKLVKRYYVYLLLLDKKEIYKGYSSDLDRRIAEHQNKKVKSTSRYNLIELIGAESYILKEDALKREKFLKTTEGRRMIKQQYRDTLQYLGYTRF